MKMEGSQAYGTPSPKLEMVVPSTPYSYIICFVSSLQFFFFKGLMLLFCPKKLNAKICFQGICMLVMEMLLVINITNIRSVTL